MRAVSFPTLLLVTLCLSPVARGAAQEVWPPEPGSRLRISHDCRSKVLSTGRTRLTCQRVEGRFASLTAGGLVELATEKSGGHVFISTRSIAKLEVMGAAGESGSGEDPSKRGARVMGQVLVGAASSIGASIPLALIGASMTSSCCGDDPGLLGAVVGLLAGASLGPSLPVYLIGNAGPAKGSYWATALGGVTGMAAFLLVRPALRLDPDYVPFWLAFYGLPTAGAVAGFHLSAKPSGQGWIDVPLDRVRVSLGPSPSGGTGVWASITF